MAKTWATPKQRRTGSHLNDVFARSDTVAARRVLRDCHIALHELEKADSDAIWRLRWITQVTLLRAAGHVLDKVDGSRSIYLRKAVDEIWGNIKSDKELNWIFFYFINIERNSILKEYRVGERIILSLDGCNEDRRERGVLIRHRVYSQRELVKHSLAWWERTLADVEERADTILKEEREKRKVQRRQIVQKAPAARRLPAVRVEIELEADKYLADLLFKVRDFIELEDGVIVVLLEANGEFAEGRKMLAGIAEHVGVRRASIALADWLKRVFLVPGVGVKVGNTMVDVHTRSLRKMLAGKIARRRTASEKLVAGEPDQDATSSRFQRRLRRRRLLT